MSPCFIHTYMSDTIIIIHYVHVHVCAPGVEMEVQAIKSQRAAIYMYIVIMGV